MNPDLEKLVLLQRTESEFKRTEAELGDVPRQKAEIDGRLQQEKTRVDAAREALAASQKTRRQQESELMDLEQKRSKYKGQLMDVKTNKEYTAMLHEIEGVEREIRAREDQILTEMERAETLSAEVKREEAVFKSAEERHKADARLLEDKLRALEAQATRLRAERDEVAATLPEGMLQLFNRVAKLRGAAVAEAKDEICQLCHVKLRPQMYMDVRRNEQIIQCPSCSRILYFEPAVPVVAPEP
jgi:predicted  nucleic acid-binding Zn-ribbon protein